MDTRTHAPRNIPEPAVQAIFAQAFQLHQQDRLAEAATLYGEILKIVPRHADSLHLLGMVAHRAGQSDAAVQLIQQAISVDNHVAVFHSNLGTVQQAQGRWEVAEQCYRCALALKPSFAEVHVNLGLTYQAQGRWAEANEAYLTAIRLNPGLAEAYSNLGNLLQEQGQPDMAVRNYRLALERKPAAAEVHHNLGHALRLQGSLDEAEECYRHALALNPALAEAHCSMGNLLQAQGRWADAADSYRRALELKPESADAHLNLGSTLAAQGDLDGAVAQLQQALRREPGLVRAHVALANVLRQMERFEEAAMHFLQAAPGEPDFADAYNNLGLTYVSLGRHQEAMAAIRQTIELVPDFAPAHCNLGVAYHAQNRMTEAAEQYRKAIGLQPDLAKAEMNLGMVELATGDFESGWKHYESRWDDPALGARKFAQPRWNGEPLRGARILLYAEQGLGDTLQFLRYVSMVQAAGGRVILEAQAGLRRLAAEIPGVEAVLSHGERLPEFQWQCPLLSLPHVFGTNLESIPACSPYLTVPDEARRRVADLSWPERGLRVGLVWAGKPTFAKDRFRFRSIGLRRFASLFGMEGVHLFSLQIGEPAEQLVEAPGPITDLSTHTTDMADTAAQIEQLDLVISVDTSVAHLAGALGVPTWILLPFTPDWRWLQEREDCPWYPSVRLFRQMAPGDWGKVVARVGAELRGLAQRVGEQQLGPAM